MAVPTINNPLCLEAIPVKPGQEHVARHIFDEYNSVKASWTDDNHLEFYTFIVLRKWHFQPGSTITDPARTTGTPPAGQPR